MRLHVKPGSNRLAIGCIDGPRARIRGRRNLRIALTCQIWRPQLELAILMSPTNRRIAWIYVHQNDRSFTESVPTGLTPYVQDGRPKLQNGRLSICGVKFTAFGVDANQFSGTTFRFAHVKFYKWSCLRDHILLDICAKSKQ